MMAKATQPSALFWDVQLCNTGTTDNSNVNNQKMGGHLAISAA